MMLSDGRPVLGSRVAPAKSAFLGSFDAVVVDLDAAIGQEELQTIPVFGEVGQCLAARRQDRPTPILPWQRFCWRPTNFERLVSEPAGGAH